MLQLFGQRHHSGNSGVGAGASSTLQSSVSTPPARNRFWGLRGSRGGGRSSGNGDDIDDINDDDCDTTCRDYDNAFLFGEEKQLDYCPYEFLGVTRQSTFKAAKNAYLRTCIRYHPRRHLNNSTAGDITTLDEDDNEHQTAGGPETGCEGGGGGIDLLEALIVFQKACDSLERVYADKILLGGSVVQNLEPAFFQFDDVDAVDDGAATMPQFDITSFLAATTTFPTAAIADADTGARRASTRVPTSSGQDDDGGVLVVEEEEEDNEDNYGADRSESSTSTRVPSWIDGMGGFERRCAADGCTETDDDKVSKPDNIASGGGITSYYTVANCATAAAACESSCDGDGGDVAMPLPSLRTQQSSSLQQQLHQSFSSVTSQSYSYYSEDDDEEEESESSVSLGRNRDRQGDGTRRIVLGRLGNNNNNARLPSTGEEDVSEAESPSLSWSSSSSSYSSEGYDTNDGTSYGSSQSSSSFTKPKRQEPGQQQQRENEEDEEQDVDLRFDDPYELFERLCRQKYGEFYSDELFTEDKKWTGVAGSSTKQQQLNQCRSNVLSFKLRTIGFRIRLCLLWEGFLSKVSST